MRTWDLRAVETATPSLKTRPSTEDTAAKMRLVFFLARPLYITTFFCLNCHLDLFFLWPSLTYVRTYCSLWYPFRRKFVLNQRVSVNITHHFSRNNNSHWVLVLNSATFPVFYVLQILKLRYFVCVFLQVLACRSLKWIQHICDVYPCLQSAEFKGHPSVFTSLSEMDFIYKFLWQI